MTLVTVPTHPDGSSLSMVDPICQSLAAVWPCVATLEGSLSHHIIVVVLVGEQVGVAPAGDPLSGTPQSSPPNPMFLATKKKEKKTVIILSPQEGRALVFKAVRVVIDMNPSF